MRARREFRLVKTILILSVMLFALTVSADPRSELVAQMELLRSSIAEQQIAAAAAEASFEQTNKELKRIKSEVAQLKSEENALVNNLNKLEKTQSLSERERSQLIDEQAKIKSRLIARIRAVYLVPRSSILAVMMTGDEIKRFGLINRYLEAVYAHDTSLAKHMRELVQKIEAHSSSIRTLVAKQRALAQDIKVRREAVAEKLATQERVTAAARVEQSRAEAAVGALRAKLLRFESTLTGLTGGTYEATEGDTSSVRQLEEGFDGPGLQKKSKVSLPASGKLVTRFGGTRRDGQPSKGLEISAVGLSSVKSIAAGRVVFVGELPSLGLVAVIDHGKRNFTLYGRLANASCTVGAVLNARDEIGEASGEQPVYFEVRQDGIAVDPRNFVSTY